VVGTYAVIIDEWGKGVSLFLRTTHFRLPGTVDEPASTAQSCFHLLCLPSFVDFSSIPHTSHPRSTNKLA
jgi:hypothetical protein